VVRLFCDEESRRIDKTNDRSAIDKSVIHGRTDHNLSEGNSKRCWWPAATHRARNFIVDEPTRGIDVGAKAEVHRLLVNLALKGKAIIMISSEMSEILAMSDRIMTVSSGRVTGFIDAKEATQEKILKCCMD
jgi:ABC-type sugar transport system ATPase subunit